MSEPRPGKDWCGPDWSRIGPPDPKGHIPRDWREEWRPSAVDYLGADQSPAPVAPRPLVPGKTVRRPV